MNPDRIGNMATRVAARRRASDWKGLTQEQRVAELKAARGQETDQDRQQAIRMLAKRDARSAEKDWATMPAEERRTFVKRVRQEASQARSSKAQK